jgi:uncharacterized protein DUF3168
MIDVEALITTYLRAQTEIVALVADRVYSDMPHERTYPLVLVTRVGGSHIYKNHLEEADVEISAYGGTHKQAYTLAYTCLSTMASGIVGSHQDGVVTKVKGIAVSYSPEPDSQDPQGHARPRVLLSATVTAHP